MLNLSYRHQQPLSLESLDVAIDQLKYAGYNLFMYYNNFELSQIQLWRSTAYLSLFADLDKSGGFFMKRWGDAPVRTLALAALHESFRSTMNLSKGGNYVVQWRGRIYYHQKLCTT